MACVVNNRLYFRVVSILYMHIIQSPFPVRFKTLSEFCMMGLRSVMSRPKKNPLIILGVNGDAVG